ncbi:MAG: acyl-CoA dehydrogenase family protein [Candidatus Omnitrophica bacterium]|nr:acyl-CoA dehydrogenase family protein [Candidatus Omnitrophota bacterium]
MINQFKKFQPRFAYKLFCAVINVAFISTSVLPPSYAQVLPTAFALPQPGAMVNLTEKFMPVIVRGITIHPENPLMFDFMVDQGDTTLDATALKNESLKLIKYFLASLTIPEKEMWVNLSPTEKDRIIPDSFGETEMGRDLLAQDYVLKQLTASLMYPEKELGQKFWQRVRERAKSEYGLTDIPMDTFNKVWIVPKSAVVFEGKNSAFVVESELDVMLEEEYSQLDGVIQAQGSSSIKSSSAKEIIKEVILPEIKKEVNTGETFANLRQIYNSMILASWYKDNLKKSLLGQVYVDQNKIRGIDVEDKNVKLKIYDQYMKAFKKGVYNYIREDYDSASKKMVPRRYFSGGETFTNLKITRQDIDDSGMLSASQKDAMNPGNTDVIVTVALADFGSNVDTTTLKQAAKELNEDQSMVGENPENKKGITGGFLTDGNLVVYDNPKIVLYPENVKDHPDVDTMYQMFESILGQNSEIVQSVGERIDTKEIHVEEPYEVTVNGKNESRESLIKQLGGLGLLGMSVPAEYRTVELGGDGKKAFPKIVKSLADKWAWYGNASIGSLVRVHGGVSTFPILIYGTEEQKKKYLPKLASGEMIGAYALTESNHGSDTLNQETVFDTTGVIVEQDGKKYVKINGSKQYITNTRFADIFTVFVSVQNPEWNKDQPDAAPQWLKSVFVVEKKDSTPDTFSFGPEMEKIGLPGSATQEIFFNDLLIPMDNLLGKLGQGDKIGMSILNYGRLAIGAGSLGGSQRILDESIRWILTRQQFGHPLADFSAVQTNIAEMEANIYAMEALVYAVSALLDNNEAPGLEASIAKVWGSNTFQKIAQMGVNLRDDEGFLKSTHVNRILGDSVVMSIFEGANEVLSSQVIAALSMKYLDKKDKLLGSWTIPQDSPVYDESLHIKQAAETIMQAKDKLIKTYGTTSVLRERGKEHLQEYFNAFGLMIADLYVLVNTLNRTHHLLLSNPQSQHERNLAKLVVEEGIRRIESNAGLILTQDEIKLVNLGTESPVELKIQVAKHILENNKFMTWTPATATDEEIVSTEGAKPVSTFLFSGQKGEYPESALPFMEDNEQFAEGPMYEGLKEIFADMVVSKQINKNLDEGHLKLTQIWDELKELGLFDPEYSTIVKNWVNQFAAYASPSLGLTLAVHNGVGSMPIKLFGSDAQKEKYLPLFNSGENIAAMAITEKEHNSDIYSDNTVLETTATPITDENGTIVSYQIKGSKDYVINASDNSIYIILASVLNESQGKQKSLFIVEHNDTGKISVTEQKNKMGLRSAMTAVVDFNITVPADRMIGEADQSDMINQNIQGYTWTALGSIYLGASDIAFKETLKYVTQRKQFSYKKDNVLKRKFIADFGAVQISLANSEAMLYALESMVYAVNAEFDSGRNPVFESAILKVIGTNTFQDIARQGVQKHGGMGFGRETEVAKYFEDSIALAQIGGSNNVLLGVVIGPLGLTALKENSGLSILENWNIPEGPLTDDVLRIKVAAKTILNMVSEFEKRGITKNNPSASIYFHLLGEMFVQLYVMTTTVNRTQHRLDKGMDSAHEIGLTKTIVIDGIQKIQKLAQELRISAPSTPSLNSDQLVALKTEIAESTLERTTDWEKPQTEKDIAMVAETEDPYLMNKADLNTPSTKDKVGGINLDRSLLNMQILRDEGGVPLPLDDQPLLEMNIEGFIPVIIQITPALNVPLLLGLAGEKKDSNSNSQRGSLDPLQKKEHMLVEYEERS